MKKKLLLEIGAGTHTGKLRARNEDNYKVCSEMHKPFQPAPSGPYLNWPSGTLLILADGMGGEQAGDTASAIAVESLQKTLFVHLRELEDPGAIERLLKQGFLEAHQDILNQAATDSAKRGMGTTLIAAWILGSHMYLSWSGDSRCYLYRRSTGLMQLSKDHSYVQELVDQGKISPLQAFYHPQNNIITQSLGNRLNAPRPDTITTHLRADDIILLCSDGLNGMLADTAIEHIIESYHNNMEQCADRLIAGANEQGGHDNITVILARILKSPEEKKISRFLYLNPFLKKA